MRCARREGIDGRIGRDERHRGAGRRPLARPRQHRRRNVEAERMPRGTDARGDRQSRRAAAAADVDYVFARRDRRPVEQRVGHGRQHRVLHFLPLRPMPPARAVPIGGLFGVPLVRRCDVHPASFWLDRRRPRAGRRRRDTPRPAALIGALWRSKALEATVVAITPASRGPSSTAGCDRSDLVDRKPPEITETRIARAEIVERNADAQRLQAP